METCQTAEMNAACPSKDEEAPGQISELLTAETFTELSRHLADLNTQLLRRNQALTILNEISQALASTLHVEQQCALLYEHISRILAADVFYVAFYDPQQDTLQSAFLMDQGRWYEGFPTSVESSVLARQVVREQRPLRLLRTSQELEEALQTVPIGDVKRPSASILMAPMLTSERFMGMLSVQSYRFEAYTEADLKLLNTIASQAALAFYNAQLWETAEKRRQEVEALDRLKSEFLANLSHEFRTPLTPILTAGSTLRDKAERLTEEEIRESGAIIVESAQRLKQLLEDLLQLATLDIGKLSLNPTETDLNQLVRDTLMDLQSRFEEKGHTFSICSQPLPPVSVDRQRIRQVLRNLAENAIKYTPPGGRIEVHTYHNPHADEVCVTVKDNGIGLTPEAQAIVFDRFRQVDGSFTRETGGVGLGLDLARGLVKLHGGRIWVESPGPGQGSTFGFALPLSA